MSPSIDRTDAVGTLHDRYPEGARIVSLVPSITELLCDLGLTDCLVGRTGFCIHPRTVTRSIPKVGGTKDVKLDAVRALAPTHLIVNIDENRRETVEALAQCVPNIVVTHPSSPEDNLQLYRLLGGIFGCDEATDRLCDQLSRTLQEARTAAIAHRPESVLYVIWRDPWMTVSRNTYIAAMLAVVGWEAIGVEAPERYPVFDWDEIRAKQPARVFLSSEPYSFRERHLDEVRQYVNCPVSLIDGEMVSWYGSRAIAGLTYLAGLRHAGH